MNVTRVKEDINAISYELLRRSGLSVKFRIKTHYEGINNQNTYYYTSYIYNSFNKRKTSILLSPRSYIQFDFGTDDGKSVFFLSEIYKNRLVKKLDKMVQLLDAYDNREIDIIKVDQSGTHINNKFPREIKISLGSNIASFSVCIREDKLDIGVNIRFNEMEATISLYDFLDLMAKLSGINYIQMTMLILNHLGPPEMGTNEVDFRPERIVGDRETEYNAIAPKSDSLLKELQTTTNKKYIRTMW